MSKRKYMDKARYLELLEKYQKDNRSLSTLEENHILLLNDRYLDNPDIYHLTKKEIYDIAINRALPVEVVPSNVLSFELLPQEDFR